MQHRGTVWSGAGRRASGFTVAEALVAAAVLAVAALSITEAMSVGHAHSYHAAHVQRAVRLGEQLMERVLALPYDDPDGDSAPGPEPGEVGRTDFDNLDDFDGYEEAAGETTDAAGEPFDAEYDRLAVTVECAYGEVDAADAAPAVRGLTVTVTVTDDKGGRWTLTRFVREPEP